MKIWQWLTGIASGLVLFLYALLQRNKAQQATKDAVRAKAAQKRSQALTEEYVEGEAEAYREVSEATEAAKTQRGYFSR